MLKPPKIQQIHKKHAAIKENGGYPNPVLILAEVLKSEDWIVNNELAALSTVTANQISRIRTGKVDDCKVSDLFKILTVLPLQKQFEFIHEVEMLLIYFRELTEYNPAARKEFLGDSPPEVGD